MATNQLTLLGIQSELVTPKKNDKGAIVGACFKARKSGVFGYVKGGDKDTNREAKAKALAERIDVSNEIAERGIPAIVEAHESGRIQFTRIQDGKSGGSLSWKVLKVREVKVPAKLTQEQVAKFLGCTVKDLEKLKNVTPKA